MKVFLQIFICCSMLLMLTWMTACNSTTDEPIDTSIMDTTPQEETKPLEADTLDVSIETTVDTEAETQNPATASIMPNTLTVDGDKVKINLTIEQKDITQDHSPMLVLTLCDADDRQLDTQTYDLVSGTSDYTLNCGKENAQSEMNIYIEACGQISQDVEVGIIYDTVTLKIKNGLPQLTNDGVRCVVAALTLEEKAHLVTGTQDVKLSGASGGTYEIPRLGIPSITVNDGPAGIRYGDAVWYPSVNNISSSWDVNLAQEIGISMGEDALAKDIDVILAPGMNIQKNVLCGRNFEYISEDPILTAYIASAYTQGIQSNGVGVSLKHFAANNQETARGSVSANVTERALREIYLKAFGMAVQSSNPYTIMSSYNLINGQRVATRYDLLTTYLRGEVGFAGLVMSDWGSGGSVVDKVNAGNDINMPGNATDPQELIDAYNAGLVDELMLDVACQNVLTLVTKCHNFTNPDQKHRLDLKNHGTQVANTASDTMILLKNNDATLPLSNDTKVAIFGNGAYNTIYGGEGSGYVSVKKTVSIAQGIQNADGLILANAENNPFANSEGHSATDSSKDVVVTEAYASACAKQADVAVIVISRSSTEGADRYTLAGDYLLNQTEADMIERVSNAFRQAGKAVIVLLNTGSPIEVVSWQDKADALLWIGYPGERAGTSVASVLTGEVNPSAKTTITWPVDYQSTPASNYFPGNASDAIYYEDIYVGYRYYTTFDVPVAYPFGYGLSYTTFSYSDYKIEKQADGSLIATVTVQNTGKVAGREVVQIYVTKPETTFEQSKLELAGFAKSNLLSAGDTQTITIHIPKDALESYDTPNSRYVIDNGTYVFSLAASSDDIKETLSIIYEDPCVLRDVENIATPDVTFDYIQKDSYTPISPEDKKENIALGKTAWDNGCENEKFSANFAVDGDMISRWSGLGASVSIHNWFLDLGDEYSIGEIVIRWESLHVPFVLYTSLDNQSYTAVGTFVNDGTGINTINLYGDTARYFKISGPVGQAFSIFEFAVYQATAEDIAQKPAEDTKKENIAIGKTVTATNHEGAYIPAYAVDGDLETRWGSLPSGEAWLQVDLHEVSNISAINLILESAWVPYRIEISSDGEHYETIYQGKKDELFVALEDLDLNARYIRLYREGANWFSIIELEVYA